MLCYPFRATHVGNSGFILVSLCASQHAQAPGNHSTSNHFSGANLTPLCSLALDNPAMLIRLLHFELHLFLIDIGCHMSKHTRIKIPFFTALLRFSIREKSLKLFKVWLC